MANRFDAGGLLQNFLTKLGTQRARSSHNRVGQRVYFQRQELDILEQHGLLKRVYGELASDAGSIPQIVTSDDRAAELEEELRRLKARQKFRRAGYLASAFGGACVWVTFDGGGLPSEPLDLTTVERVRNLVVIERFDLQPQMPALGS